MATAPEALHPTPAQLKSILDAGASEYYRTAATDKAILARGYALSGESVALVNLVTGVKSAMQPLIEQALAGDIAPIRAFANSLSGGLGIVSQQAKVRSCYLGSF